MEQLSVHKKLITRLFKAVSLPIAPTVNGTNWQINISNPLNCPYASIGLAVVYLKDGVQQDISLQFPGLYGANIFLNETTVFSKSLRYNFRLYQNMPQTQSIDLCEQNGTLAPGAMIIEKGDTSLVGWTILPYFIYLQEDTTNTTKPDTLPVNLTLIGHNNVNQARLKVDVDAVQGVGLVTPFVPTLESNTLPVDVNIKQYNTLALPAVGMPVDLKGLAGVATASATGLNVALTTIAAAVPAGNAIPTIENTKVLPAYANKL